MPNLVIKGLKSTWKLITKGYGGSSTVTGEFVIIEKHFTEPYLSQHLHVDPYLFQDVSECSYLSQKLGVQHFMNFVMSVENYINNKLSTEGGL